MSRSLPLENPGDAMALSGSVAVFDPAMCCDTGVCGPGVDPALLAIARDLRWLEKHGVTVQRAGLAQEPDTFVANARVSGLMQAFGDGALPAVLVNGEVLCYGRYPTRAELIAALTPRSSSAPATTSSCCTPGSDCC
ncbi:MAG: arsenite efflux transporter metallochaperone ArsD [bacterium]